MNDPAPPWLTMARHYSRPSLTTTCLAAAAVMGILALVLALGLVQPALA